MIRHRIGTDTRVSFDWTDDLDQPIVVTSAVLLINGTSAPTLVEINDEYPVQVHILDTYSIAAGNHQYELRATDAANGDVTLLSAGLLRVR